MNPQLPQSRLVHSLSSRDPLSSQHQGRISIQPNGLVVDARYFTIGVSLACEIRRITGCIRPFCRILLSPKCTDQQRSAEPFLINVGERSTLAT